MEKQLGSVILILVSLVGVGLAFTFLGPFFGALILLKSIFDDIPDAIKKYNEETK